MHDILVASVFLAMVFSPCIAGYRVSHDLED
jgi:hypothetical protein